MATIEERNILATQILPAIGASYSRLPLADVTGFLAMAGHLYQSGLMVANKGMQATGNSRSEGRGL